MADIAGRSIFISYRRADAEGEAGRLYDDLVRAYGDSNVFMDVAGIQPGLDFRKAIDANVSGCGVLLAVIGPGWASVTGSNGSRRLDNPDDYVRLEIAAALARGIPVIPVLVHEGHMPTLEQLPDNLKDLRYRNSVELTHARWNSDVALLIAALKSYVNVDQKHDTETVHATVPVQLPAPQAPASAPGNPSSTSKLPLFLGIGVAAVLICAVIVFVVMRGSSAPQSQSPPTGSTTAAPPDPAAAFFGDWQDVKMPKTGDNLFRLRISAEGPAGSGRYLVNAWGSCALQLCDWGSHHAKLNGDELVTESWELKNTPKEVISLRTAVIRMRVSDSRLAVTVRNNFAGKAQEDSDTKEMHLDFTKGFRIYAIGGGLTPRQ